MGVSVWQILIIAVVILVLFGRGRISEMMGDFGKGISSFKKGLNEGSESNVAPPPAARIEGPSAGEGPAARPAEAARPGDTTRA